MEKQVYWTLKAKIAEGGLSELKALIAEASQTTKDNEPGALEYQWFIDPTDQYCYINERYADSEAVLTHMANFGKQFGKRFTGLLSVESMLVFGQPDEAATKALKKIGAEFCPSLGGFTR